MNGFWSYITPFNRESGGPGYFHRRSNDLKDVSTDPGWKPVSPEQPSGPRLTISIHVCTPSQIFSQWKVFPLANICSVATMASSKHYKVVPPGPRPLPRGDVWLTQPHPGPPACRGQGQLGPSVGLLFWRWFCPPQTLITVCLGSTHTT